MGLCICTVGPGRLCQDYASIILSIIGLFWREYARIIGTISHFNQNYRLVCKVSLECMYTVVQCTV